MSKMFEFVVFKKLSAVKHPDDLQLLVSFWSVHSMETLLSHEATGEELWMAVNRGNHSYRSHNKANIADVVCLNFSHTFYWSQSSILIKYSAYSFQMGSIR